MPRVVALMAVRNEADVIVQTIGDLIEQGCEVVLIDHGSTDETVERASRFLGRGLISVERFADRGVFDWRGLLARKEELARTLEADWFIHADADELREPPLAGRTLAEAIGDVDRMGYDAIDFEVIEFVPTDDRFRDGDDLRQAFVWFRPSAVWDRLQIKCWKRNPRVSLAGSGGHEAIFDGRRVFPVRFLLRHYPIRSQAHGARKVWQERLPRFTAEERAAGWHVQYDQLKPDHRFVRPSGELERYDGARLRLKVWSTPRDPAGALAAAATWLERLADERVQTLEKQRQTESRLDTLYGTRSWRFTAGARLVWRALGGE
jgi:glycosyltransferase involved in cell wall biosynthesis